MIDDEYREQVISKAQAWREEQRIKEAMCALSIEEHYTYGASYCTCWICGGQPEDHRTSKVYYYHYADGTVGKRNPPNADWVNGND